MTVLIRSCLNDKKVKVESSSTLNIYFFWGDLNHGHFNYFSFIIIVLFEWSDIERAPIVSHYHELDN